MTDTYKAINWTKIDDVIDRAAWEKLTEQFWLDTQIPVDKDLDDWRTLDDTHRWVISHIFGGLTLLDTLQSQDGMAAIRQDAKTPHEIAVLNNIQFMESIHAKSYSTIFSTLNSPEETQAIFDWSDSENLLQTKAIRIRDLYHDDDAPLKKKIANVFLETFLFYSGFYTPLYYLGHNKLTHVGEMVKLILRDESVHGTYIGYKFQVAFNQLTDIERQSLKDWMYTFLYELYENEEQYSHLVYDQVGWTSDVLTFIRYNANKALMNLGQDPLFPDTADDVNTDVMAGISTSTANHDFFSQTGNGYLLGNLEPMLDSDYDI